MNRGIILGVFLVSLILAVSVFVIAKPDFVSIENPAGNSFEIPENAVQISEGVFSLGEAVDVDGRIVQGFMFIDYRKGNASPPRSCDPWPQCKKGGNGGGGDTDTSSCYGFLARGAKWKSVEPYMVDPTNTRGLNSDFVSSNLASDIDKWESAAAFDIFGDKTSGTVNRTNIGDLNGQNEVMFADIVEYEDAIAIAIIWGIFGGPPPFRELVEWDMVFDDVDFDWAKCVDETCNAMDFENIATHELGHAVGLDDLYDSKCSEMTMYGYASYGETKKRTLEDGDTTGIQKLYA